MDKLKDTTDSLLQRRVASDVGRLFFSGQGNRVDDWKSQDTEYQAEFLATAHLLSDMEGLADDPDIKALGCQSVQVPWHERTRENWPKLAVAASLVMAFMVGMATLWLPQNTTEDTVLRYGTRVGEQKTIELNDGSQITLNTGTQLLVKFSPHERKIILEQGEAWFDVVSDPERPFTIDAGFRSVTVLGTAFSVNRYPDKLQVAVKEGMVSMHSSEESPSNKAPLLGESLGESRKSGSSLRDEKQSTTEAISTPAKRQYRIKAGWVAEFDEDKQEISAYAPQSMDAMLSWRSGVLDFPGTPLVKVVQELNRYSGKKILIEDADIIDLKVIAVFKVDRLDLALDGLEYTLPINVTHHFDRIALTYAKK